MLENCVPVVRKNISSGEDVILEEDTQPDMEWAQYMSDIEEELYA